MFSKKLLAEYRRFRDSGMVASHAMDAARTELQWERLEDAGFVALTAEPDADYVWEDEAEREKYGDDGAWGSVGWFTLAPEEAVTVQPSFRRGGPWRQGDSVWGHVGYRDVLDSAENWYVADIKRATIDALATALKSRCPVCRQATA